VPGGGFVLIYSDVTERKRAEQAVSAARYAAETALRDLQMAKAGSFRPRSWPRSAS
jgi:two-component system NtrC family sensor kinase